MAAGATASPRTAAPPAARHRIGPARRVAAPLEDCRRCGLEAGTYQEIKSALTRRAEPDADAVERLRGFTQGLLRHGTDGEGQAP